MFLSSLFHRFQEDLHSDDGLAGRGALRKYAGKPRRHLNAHRAPSCPSAASNKYRNCLSRCEGRRRRSAAQKTLSRKHARGRRPRASHKDDAAESRWKTIGGQHAFVSRIFLPTFSRPLIGLRAFASVSSWGRDFPRNCGLFLSRVERVVTTRDAERSARCVYTMK